MSCTLLSPADLRRGVGVYVWANLIPVRGGCSVALACPAFQALKSSYAGDWAAHLDCEYVTRAMVCEPVTCNMCVMERLHLASGGPIPRSCHHVQPHSRGERGISGRAKHILVLRAGAPRLQGRGDRNTCLECSL